VEMQYIIDRSLNNILSDIWSLILKLAIPPLHREWYRKFKLYPHHILLTILAYLRKAEIPHVTNANSIGNSANRMTFILHVFFAIKGTKDVVRHSLEE